MRLQRGGLKQQKNKLVCNNVCQDEALKKCQYRSLSKLQKAHHLQKKTSKKAPAIELI